MPCGMSWKDCVGKLCSDPLHPMLFLLPVICVFLKHNYVSAVLYLMTLDSFLEG